MKSLILFAALVGSCVTWAGALKWTCKQQNALLVPRPKRAGFFVPPGRERLGIGVMVTLEDGRKVIVVGGAITAQHDEVLAAAEQKLGQKTTDPHWGGEVAMGNNGQVWSLGNIEKANETSGYFNKRGFKSDSNALKQATKQVGPGLWSVPPDQSTVYDEKHKHLHPGMMNRHDIDNLLQYTGMVIEGLKSRLQEGDLAGYMESLPSYRAILEPRKDTLEHYFELLENDQVISAAEHASMSRKLEAVTTGKRMLLSDWEEWETEMALAASRVNEIRQNLSDHITIIDVPE